MNPPLMNNNMINKINFPMMPYNYFPNYPNSVSNQNQKIDDKNDTNKKNFNVLFNPINTDDKNSNNKNNF